MTACMTKLSDLAADEAVNLIRSNDGTRYECKSGYSFVVSSDTLANVGKCVEKCT